MDKLLETLEPRVILLLMGAAALLAVAALFSYGIWPGVRDYNESVHSRTVLAKVVESSKALDTELSSLRVEVESLEQQLHGDTAKLPENQLEAFIIGRLQSISWRNNMQLLGVKPGKGNKVHIFEEALFEVEISGDYFDLFNWLQDLGEDLGFVVVKHFTIRPLDQKETNPRLNAKLTIVSYRE
ncbi:MAG: type 4a pilus biogenesis protein PilO [Gammaproteobacteria bacterium]|jgi:Tfp pilus assembly protein PilO|nr:type 4a pilus biogenesis protein PilO [Gammaproteobacteria bacterium]MDH3561124.1 type 4a pilus biogenesis protein PilO [Gammaproteobacteria bacterium]